MATSLILALSEASIFLGLMIGLVSILKWRDYSKAEDKRIKKLLDSDLTVDSALALVSSGSISSPPPYAMILCVGIILIALGATGFIATFGS